MTLLSGRAATGIVNFRQTELGGPVPVVETESSRFGGTSTVQTIIKPTGTVEGDLLIASIAVYDNGVSTLTPPSDAVPWIEIVTGQVPANTLSSGLWYKVAGASEEADYEWTNTTSEWWGMSMLRISGQNLSNPINAFSAEYLNNTPGNNDEFDCASVTTTITNCLLLSHCMAGNIFVWPDPPFALGFTAPAPHPGLSFIHNIDGGGSTAVNIMMAQENLSAGGPTGFRRFDGRDQFSGNEDRSQGLLAIAPTGGGSVSNLKYENDDFCLLEASEGRLILEV